MTIITNFIDSGLLQSYVLGMTTPEENQEIESMAYRFPEIRAEIEAFEKALEAQAFKASIHPPAALKLKIFAAIEKIQVSSADKKKKTIPVLHPGSQVKDYDHWLNVPGLTLPSGAGDIYAKVLSTSNGVTTSVVWLQGQLPEEVHETELEMLLILEGSCNIYIDGEVHHLFAGDYFNVPLYKKHSARVTSAIPCKALLQRIAV